MAVWEPQDTVKVVREISSNLVVPECILTGHLANGHHSETGPSDLKPDEGDQTAGRAANTCKYISF